MVQPAPSTVGPAEAAWISYLSSVDDVQQSSEVITTVAQAFIMLQLFSPDAAVGVKEFEVADTIEDNVAAKALVRRTLRALEQSEAVRRATELAQTNVPQLSGLGFGEDSGVGLTGGSQGSALALAQAGMRIAASPKKPEVDVHRLLSEHGFAKIPSDGIPELSIFEDLARDNQTAEATGRSAFTFVDLTQKEVSPLWLTPESIGGKTVVPGQELHISEDSQMNSIARFPRL